MTRPKHAARTGGSRSTGRIAMALLLGLWLIPASITLAQDQGAVDANDADIVAGSDAATVDTAEDVSPTSAAKPRNPMTYGLWVLVPAIVAILLAIFTRQVVPALVVAILVGAYMMFPCLGTDDPLAGLNPVVGGFRLAAETYVVGVILDSQHGYAHVKIMIFTLVIGFLIGVIGRNGGTAGMVKVVVGDTTSPRRGGLTAWVAGLVVFFDDYANTMIVGPTMRSVFDRVKLSRAKLAYIVDSTAAPVASLALIGTWVGAEIGFIQDGLDKVQQAGTPAFLIDSQGGILNGMQAFLASLPYRFYPIFALVLVFLVALTRRDFGPMKKSEARAVTEPGHDVYEPQQPTQRQDQPQPRWWLGLLPVLGLVIATVVVLVITGLHSSDTIEAMAKQAEWEGQAWWERAGVVIGNADAYNSIFYGAILSAIFAVLLTILSGACRVRDAVDAGLDGMARMFPAIVILILAWGLSHVSQNLMLGEVVGDYLTRVDFPIQFAPLAIFIAAAVISFATGTSWGTMGILCPMTVTIFVSLAATTQGLESPQTLNLFYASVGSVLAGAIFGDHCSPISDTTVLSSIASGCRHEEHVWTQIPYALLAAIVAMACGDVLCSVYHQPSYYGIAAGVVVLLLVVLIFGRQPKPIVPPGPPDSRLAPPPEIERRLRGPGFAPPADDGGPIMPGQPAP